MAIRLKNGLTPKQNKLVKVVATQILETGKTNMTQAGLQVYDSKNPEVARVIASETIQKPAVKDSLEKALEDNGVSYKTVIENFNKIASKVPEKVTGEAFLKANIELAKVLNMYPGKKVTKTSLSLYGNVKDMDYKTATEAYKGIRGETDELLEDAN